MATAWSGRAGGRLGVGRNLCLSAYWFSLNFLWGAMLAVLLPTQVLAFVPGAAKASAVGLVAAAGALVAVLAQPLAGAWSDRTRGRWGRRRPYVVAGSLAAAGALWVMAGARGLAAFVAGFLLLQAAVNLAGAPYQAYIPDVVPADQRGVASGYMGLMSMLGSLAGLAAAGLLVRPGETAAIYVWLGGVLIAGALLTAATVPDAPEPRPPQARHPRTAAPAPPPRFWIGWRQHPDYWRVLVTRALVMMAFYTTLAFLEYFLRDVTGLAGYVRATAEVGAVTVLAAAAASPVAGWLSDRVGRRAIVAGAGAIMGLAAIFLALARAAASAFPGVLAAGAVFGLAYGAFTSVDWALAVDVLPAGGAAAAKDLGIWSVSATLPQVLAPAAGGLLIAALAPSAAHLGYRLVYVLTGVYAMAGSVLVLRVRSVR